MGYETEKWNEAVLSNFILTIVLILIDIQYRFMQVRLASVH